MSSVFYIIATLKKMLISFRLLQCWNIGHYFWWHHHFLALEIYHTCFFSATSGVGTFWSKLLRFLVAVDCDLQTKYIVGTKSNLMQEKLPMCFGLINHKYIVLHMYWLKKRSAQGPEIELVINEMITISHGLALIKDIGMKIKNFVLTLTSDLDM